MQRYASIFLVIPLLLAACSGGEVRNSLGLNAKAPDEFVVYARPPLSVPPEFDLKPPRPGEESPFVATSEDVARATLLGTKTKPATLDDIPPTPDVPTAVTPVITSDAPTPAQSHFLKRAGTDSANDAIREQLVKDKVAAPKKQKKAESLYERIIGADQSEPVVDAKAEAERIRSNKDNGKPITEGETPIEDPKKKSVFDTIF